MSLTALLFYLSSGVMLAAAIQAVALALFSGPRKLLGTFAVAAVSAAVYQYYSGHYYQATSVAESLHALRIQSSAVIVGLFFIAWFMGLYTRFAHTERMLPMVAVWCVLMLVINWQSPGTIRFDGDVHQSVLILSWGERLTTLVGSPGDYGWLLHGGGLIFLFWVLYQSISLWRQRLHLKSTLLGIYVLVQIAAASINMLIDQGVLSFFYVSGFAVVVLLLMLAAGIAMDIRKQSETLEVISSDLDASVARSSELEHDNDMLVQLFTQLPMPAQVIDRQTRVLLRNRAAHLLGSLNVAPGRPLAEAEGYLATPYANALASAFEGQFVETEPFSFEGSSRENAWFKARLFPLRDPRTGEVEQVALINEDFTQKRAIQTAVISIAEGVSLASDERFFDSMVQQLARIFSAKYVFLAEALPQGAPTRAKTLSMFVDGEKAPNISYDLATTPCEGVLGNKVCSYSKHIQQRFPEDQMLKDIGAESYLGAPLLNEQGDVRGMLVVIDSKPMADISERQAVLEIFAARAGAELQRMAAEKEIHRLAFEDYITRLPNRSQLHQDLLQLFDELEGQKQKANLYLLDLDFFKNINDALGHDSGDKVLRAMSTRFEAALPKNVRVYRFGGDEFIFIETPVNGSDDTVKATAQHLINQASEPIKVGDHYLSIGASIGCVKIPDQSTDELSALRCLELALYEAKDAGRDRYEIFNPDQIEESNERIIIRSELKAAIQSSEFDLYVQPQVDEQGRLVGGEALVRWIHPQRGFMAPNTFIPIAEESGLIHALGAWVIERACEYIVNWTTRGVDFQHLSVNISAWQVAHPDFEQNLYDCVQRYGVSPDKLTLEVTETTILRDIHSIISVFDRLRSRGFRIALDDFGTGYSSLAYLRDLPLDELKIDRSFVVAMEDRKSQALVRSMIAICRNMQLDVVAEGVETDRQRATLENLGCGVFQGYLYARPMPEHEFLEWYANIGV